MASIFNSNDWSVEKAPILGWGRNQNGTFCLYIERYKEDGTPYRWTMNVPKNKESNLPQILDAVPEAERSALRFTGGWHLNNADIDIDDGKD